jgi:hypothetical protein
MGGVSSRILTSQFFVNNQDEKNALMGELPWKLRINNSFG